MKPQRIPCVIENVSGIINIAMQNETSGILLAA